MSFATKPNFQNVANALTVDFSLGLGEISCIVAVAAGMRIVLIAGLIRIYWAPNSWVIETRAGAWGF